MCMINNSTASTMNKAAVLTPESTIRTLTVKLQWQLLNSNITITKRQDHTNRPSQTRLTIHLTT